MENNCGNNGNSCGNQICVGLTFELSLEAGNVLKLGKDFLICEFSDIQIRRSKVKFHIQ